MSLIRLGHQIIELEDILLSERSERTLNSCQSRFPMASIKHGVQGVPRFWRLYIIVPYSQEVCYTYELKI